MRIGIMCLAGFGGSARIATQLALQLAGRGHRVHLFARTTPFGDGARVSGVKLHTVRPDLEGDVHPADLDADWSPRDYGAFLRRVLNVITNEGLDILHYHYGVPFAYLAAEVKGWSQVETPQVVGTLHGTDVSIYGQDPAIRPRLREALRLADALTTVSHSHAWLARDVLGLPTQPQVIANFVDLDIFRPPKSLCAPQHGIGEHRNSCSRPRIAHVSNFRPVKDSRSVAHIFLGIRQRMEAELWLIGDGPEMSAVKSILGGSEFENDVRHWGLQHDVAPLLAQADLLLMTSLYESFCLAALEAMACGVPVLATRVGGLPEVVIHGTTGALFSPNDHQAAVDLAVTLLADRSRYRAMQEAAIRHAARFACQQIVPIYEDLYRTLLTARFVSAMHPAGIGARHVLA